VETLGTDVRSCMTFVQDHVALDIAAFLDDCTALADVEWPPHVSSAA
jgi:hypothetical protein